MEKVHASDEYFTAIENYTVREFIRLYPDYGYKCPLVNIIM